jgi:hypothetical protein
MLIDSGSIHNFVNYKLAKIFNLFVYLALEFQVMIVDGGSMNFSGKCHSIKFNIREYLLYIPIISIQMGGVDVVLGVQWIQPLGTLALNFQELFMRLSSEGKEFELRGIQGNLSKVISSNNMKKLLKKGHHGVLSQVFSLDVQTSRPFVPWDLQKVNDNHSKVFEEITKGIQPAQYVMIQLLKK